MYKKNIKIDFFDCDPGGIIFYANAFKIAHRCYEEFLASLDLERDYFADEEHLLPIVHSESDYYKPIKSHDEITVELIVSKIGDSSFELTYMFKDKSGDEKVKVKTVHVAVSRKDFSKTGLPEDLRSKLNRHLNR